MRFALFYHSLVSDWNHGNAHFLRGIVLELQSRGYDVRVFEPSTSWSRENLLHDQGLDAIAAFEKAFPSLRAIEYNPHDLRIDEWLDGVDVAIVHEWNDCDLVKQIGEYRMRNPKLRLFFHDTHHRALTKEDELSRFDLSAFDGVLAYGGSLKETYERRGWSSQVYIWHEAADIRTFYPRQSVKEGGLIWIGNWGDEERTEELREYLIEPVKALRLKTEVFGVRYPRYALDELQVAGIDYRGWIANFSVPQAFARFRVTIHVPRRPYVQHLRGIPTIRPFEALACGIPLISAPWRDSENLFRVGADFLMVHSGEEMKAKLNDVLCDAALAAELSTNGLNTILSRHTCRHRVDELLTIYRSVRPELRTQEESRVLEVAS